MNTKQLMIINTIFPGLVGIIALFAPHELLMVFNSPISNPLPVFIQLLGALYLALAFINWTAKDSLIGGVYGRPISLGNLAHYTIGMLILAKYQISIEVNLFLMPMLVIYTMFAIIFGWLIFVSSGIIDDKV